MNILIYHHDIYRFYATVALVVMIVSSCSFAQGIGEEKKQITKPAVKKTSQIIIKFSDKVIDPSNSAFVREISETAKVNLRYLRPMSGGAHVYRVEKGAAEPRIEEIVGRLSKRPDVLFAEPDNIMVRQQNQE